MTSLNIFNQAAIGIVEEYDCSSISLSEAVIRLEEAGSQLRSAYATEAEGRPENIMEAEFDCFTTLYMRAFGRDDVEPYEMEVRLKNHADDIFGNGKLAKSHLDELRADCIL